MRYEYDQQLSPQRTLEEVLRDPSADWEEIRSAIKGQRGSSACTNVAIMQALANKQSWAAAAVATAIVMKEEQQQDDEERKLETNDNGGDFGNGSSSGSISNHEAGNEIEVLTTPMPLVNGLKKSLVSKEIGSNNLKGSFRMSRRRRGSATSSFLRRSGRRRGSRRNSGSFLRRESEASINIMDFGVIETILDLSDSNRSSDQAFRGSGDYSDDVSNSGFMGWKHHDDISVKSSFTLDKSIQRGGSDDNDSSSIILSEGDVDELRSSSSLSSLVDSSGFLDWRHSSKRHSSFIEAVDEDGVDSAGFLNWSQSSKMHCRHIHTVDEVADEESCSKNETWNIADYDGTDNDKRSCDQTRMSALTNRLRRLGSAHKTGIDQKEDITIGDIKEALLNVRKAECSDKEEESALRRRTNGGFPGAVSQSYEEESRQRTFYRRKTVIGNVNLIGTVLNYKPMRNGVGREENRLDGPANESKNKTESRRKAIMEGISPFVGKRRDQVGSDSDRSPNQDDRKAIWISRKDGNIDIEKERRKLYGDLDSFSTHST